MLGHLVIWGLTGYAVVGVVFGVAFVMRGAGVVDPVAKQTTVGFKFMILPGAIGLWPWLAVKWVRRREA